MRPGAGDAALGATLARAVAPSGSVCRCGCKLTEVSPSWTFSRVPPSVRSLFRDLYFCGVPCVRASLLESLEIVESSGSPRLVADYREVAEGIRLLLLASAHPGAGG